VVAALRRHRPLLLALLGGVVFALTSPPTDLYPAVIIGLALLAASLSEPAAPRKAPRGVADASAPALSTPPSLCALPLGFFSAFGRGAAWGTAAGIVGLRFVPSVIQRFTPLGSAASYLALVLLAAVQSLIWAIGAGLVAVLHRRVRVPFELSFAIGVFIAISLPTIFTWTPAGLVSPWPAFVQLADLIGERGVSALFAVGAALLCRATLALYGWIPGQIGASVERAPEGRRFWIRPAVLRPAGAAVALFALLAIYGALRIRAITRESEGLPTVRVGLVDQSVGPHERWDPRNSAAILRSLRDLTRKLEEQGVELTVWPEAAYPYTLDHDTRRAPRGPTAILGNKIRGPIVVGLITRDKPVTLPSGQLETNTYNSATLVLPDGSMTAPYDKLQLLWFGETVPAGAQLPWLRRIFQKSGGLIPGTEPRALELPRTAGPDLRMGVLNCYEDTLAGIGRRIATSLRPNLLVNVTNDAWFFGTAEPELHARLGAMRAIELRRDLIRAVNMGVTSWIDAAGVERSRYDGSAPATLLVTPAVRDGDLSLYARLGDAPLLSLFALALAAFAWRARRHPAPEAPAR
jgi:apolipoprotein N-acyltransferase